MKKMKLQKSIAVCSVVGFSRTQTWAEVLKDIYELALINDPTCKAAEASFRAGKEYKGQGRAGLLPALSISGSTGWNEYRRQ